VACAALAVSLCSFGIDAAADKVTGLALEYARAMGWDESYNKAQDEEQAEVSESAAGEIGVEAYADLSAYAQPFSGEFPGN
jgi:hypothetical protein